MYDMVISKAGVETSMSVTVSRPCLPLLDVSGISFFLTWTGTLMLISTCVVREVQDELYERKGIRIPMTRVIMTSDESDQTWWDEVTALGWVRMDHDEQQTVATYGRWYVCSLAASVFAFVMPLCVYNDMFSLSLSLCILGIPSSSIPQFSLWDRGSWVLIVRPSLSYRDGECWIGRMVLRAWCVGDTKARTTIRTVIIWLLGLFYLGRWTIFRTGLIYLAHLWLSISCDNIGLLAFLIM
jgi:hypothetical protein